MAASAMTEAMREILRSPGRLAFGLSAEEARLAVDEILVGNAEPALIASFLTMIALVPDPVQELIGAVRAVRSRMIPLEIPGSLRPILDTCGTGGDGANSVNISTATAIVVAACGCRVAKHGNRSASGNSGSSEVLTQLGVNIEPSPVVLERCLAEVGITFLFAPRFHPSLKHVASIRRQLPFRTLFNLVGPLANPAFPDFQLLGVPNRDVAMLMDYVIRELDESVDEVLQAAFVVSGADGLDEISLSGPNLVHAIGVEEMGIESWGPADFGLSEVAIDALRVNGPAESALKIRELLDGQPGPIRDVVLANASAALLLVGKAKSLIEGVALAAEAIDRGDADHLLGRWAEISQQSE